MYEKEEFFGVVFELQIETVHIEVCRSFAPLLQMFAPIRKWQFARVIHVFLPLPFFALASRSL